MPSVIHLVLEGLILPYYLKIFSFLFVIIAIISFILFYSILNKQIVFEKKYLSIVKGENFSDVLNNKIFNLKKVEKLSYTLFYKINSKFSEKFIHYGDFSIESGSSFIEIYNIITESSNVLNKITIIEGWTINELNNELSKYFNDFKTLKYQEILADTYYFNKNMDFNLFYKKLTDFKKSHFQKYKENNLNLKFSENEIMVIGSLIEKEGLDYEDKKKISSVIFNRLNKNMKLQIDATVIYAITKGKFKLNRKLNYNDLKIDDKYNTYKYIGIPPNPISFVGTKTIDIIYENYNTEFLFYFFNNSLNKHVFSKNYEDHKKKLNEYRKTK